MSTQHQLNASDLKQSVTWPACEDFVKVPGLRKGETWKAKLVSFFPCFVFLLLYCPFLAEKMADRSAQMYTWVLPVFAETSIHLILFYLVGHLFFVVVTWSRRLGLTEGKTTDVKTTDVQPKQVFRWMGVKAAACIATARVCRVFKSDEHQ